MNKFGWEGSQRLLNYIGRHLAKNQQLHFLFTAFYLSTFRQVPSSGQKQDACQTTRQKIND
jgi:hypothetical protein